MQQPFASPSSHKDGVSLPGCHSPKHTKLLTLRSKKGAGSKMAFSSCCLYLLFIFDHEGKYFLYALLNPSGETQVINTLHHWWQHPWHFYAFKFLKASSSLPDISSPSPSKSCLRLLILCIKSWCRGVSALLTDPSAFCSLPVSNIFVPPCSYVIGLQLNL